MVHPGIAGSPVSQPLQSPQEQYHPSTWTAGRYLTAWSELCTSSTGDLTTVVVQPTTGRAGRSGLQGPRVAGNVEPVTNLTKYLRTELDAQRRPRCSARNSESACRLARSGQPQKTAGRAEPHRPLKGDGSRNYVRAVRDLRTPVAVEDKPTLPNQEAPVNFPATDQAETLGRWLSVVTGRRSETSSTTPRSPPNGTTQSPRTLPNPEQG